MHFPLSAVFKMQLTLSPCSTLTLSRGHPWPASELVHVVLSPQVPLTPRSSSWFLTSIDSYPLEYVFLNLFPPQEFVRFVIRLIKKKNFNRVLWVFTNISSDTRYQNQNIKQLSHCSSPQKNSVSLWSQPLPQRSPWQPLICFLYFPVYPFRDIIKMKSCSL